MNWNEKANYFDEDTLAAEWFNHLCHRVDVHIIKHQKELLYMASETENGLPKFKEGAIEQMRDYIIQELGWMIESIIDALIKVHRINGNIDLSEEMIYWLIDEMGAEGYGAWEIDARHKIFNEYADILGEDRAKELAEKWWGNKYEARA